MSSLQWGMLAYAAMGVLFALWHMEADVERERRARNLRKALQFEVDERPMWLCVGLLSTLRAIAWPLHLLLHED